MVRRDLTNEEIDQMGRENPGSAKKYLRLRREEIEAEKQAKREADDYARFERAFVEAGGSKSEAKSSYKALKNERASEAARTADEAAEAYARRTAFRSA